MGTSSQSPIQRKSPEKSGTSTSAARQAPVRNTLFAKAIAISTADRTVNAESIAHWVGSTMPEMDVSKIAPSD